MKKRKLLKGITLAASLCSCLGIFLGIGYSLNVFKQTHHRQQIQADITEINEVDHSLMYLEYGLDSLNSNQLKDLKNYITISGVTDQNQSVPLNQEAYQIVSVTYYQADDTEATSFAEASYALLSLDFFDLPANESLKTIRVNTIVSANLHTINLKVNEDKGILQNGVYKLKTGSSDDSGNLVESIFLTTRPSEELLEYLDISLQFQHVAVPLEVVKSASEKFGEVNSYGIRQKSFEAGFQPITVEVGFEEISLYDSSETIYRSGSLTVQFEEKSVFYIKAEQKSADYKLFSYSDLAEAFDIRGYYNDGTSELLRDNEYSYTSFFPTKKDFGTGYQAVESISNFSSTGTRMGIDVDEAGNRFGNQKVPGTNTNLSYQRDIVVSYKNVTYTIPNVNFNLANPYLLSLEGSPILQQTEAEPFNLDGLTATISYATQFQDQEVTASNLFGQTYYGGSSEVLNTKPVRISLKDFSEYVQISYNYTKDDAGTITSPFYDIGDPLAVVPSKIDSIAIRFTYTGTMYFTARTLPRTTGAALVTTFERNASSMTSTFDGLSFQIKASTSTEGVTYSYTSPVVDLSTEEFYEGITKTIYNLDFSSMSHSNPIGFLKENEYLTKGVYLSVYLTNDAGLKAYKASNGQISFGNKPDDATYIRNRTLFYYEDNEVKSTPVEVQDSTILPVSLDIEYGVGRLVFSKPCSILLEFELEQPEDVQEHRYWGDSQEKTVEFPITIRKGNLDVVYTQVVNGSNFIIDGNQINIASDTVIENLESIGVYFRRNGTNISSLTSPKDYKIYIYSTETVGNNLPYRGENSWIYSYRTENGRSVLENNPLLRSCLGEPKSGDTFYIFLDYSGNDYYYRGSTETNPLEVHLVLRDIENDESAIVQDYNRSTVESIITYYTKQFNSLYTIDLLDSENQPLALNQILHQGEYWMRFVRDGASYTRLFRVTPQSYNDVETEYTEELTYGRITEETIQNLKAAALKAIELMGYYELDDEAVISYFNLEGAQSSNLNLLPVGSCYALFSTKTADMDAEGDYNLPRIRVNFTLNKLTLNKVTIDSESPFAENCETTYTGQNLEFILNREGWEAVKDFVRLSVRHAYRIDDSGSPIESEMIPSYLYVLNSETGRVTVGAAGQYTVDLTCNENCVWEEGAQTTFTFTVLKDELSIELSSSAPSQTAGVFMGVDSFVTITGNGETNNSNDPIRFSVSNAHARVYQFDHIPTETITEEYLTTYGTLIPSTENLVVDGIYYVLVKNVTSTYFYFQAGNVYGFPCSENYKAISLILPLEIKRNELAKLEFRTDRDDLRPLAYEEQDTYSITIDYETLSGRTEEVLEYTYGESQELLRLFISSSVSSIGANAYRFILIEEDTASILDRSLLEDLHAGKYIIVITPNVSSGSSSFTWAPGAKNIALRVIVKKQETDTPSIVLSTRTYDGEEHTEAVGGTSSYWASALEKGVTATVYRMDTEATEFDKTKAIALDDAFDISKGSFTATEAGKYYVEFHLPSLNYYWDTNATGSNDFDYALAEYTTEVYMLATIHRLQIEAPMLGQNRAHTFDGNPVDFALLDSSGNVKPMLVDDFQISYTLLNENTKNPLDTDLNQVGYYHLILTMDTVTYKGKEVDVHNFVWVRNYSDFDGLMYQDPDLQDSYGAISFTEDSYSVLTLNYSILETTLDINISAFQSFFYGGYTTDFIKISSLEDFLKASATPRNDPMGELTEENKEILSQATLTIKENEVEVLETYKLWNVGDHNVRVLLEFADNNYRALEFSLRITVERLPIALVITGTKTYGDAASLISWNEYSYETSSMHFIGSVPEMSFAYEDLDEKTIAGAYQSNQLLPIISQEDESYFENYSISLKTFVQVVPKELVLTFIDPEQRKSTYLAAIDFYDLILENNLTTLDQPRLRSIISASISSLDAGDQTITYELLNSNYQFSTGNHYTELAWHIAKAEVEVTLTLSQIYGEAPIVDFIFNSSGGQNVSVSFNRNLQGTSIEGEGIYEIIDTKPVYKQGFEHKNYAFVDSGKGSIVYNPLEVVISINDSTSQYYKQSKLSYEISVVSETSNQKGKIPLTAALLAELTGNPAQSTATGEVWSLGAVTSEDITTGLFSLFTTAYTYSSEETLRTPTANVGEYPIVGVAKNQDHFQIRFQGGTYTVTPADFNLIFQSYGTYNETESKWQAEYDDKTHHLLEILVKDAVDSYQISYRLGETGSYNTALPTAIDAGTYKVYYQVESQGNYKLATGSIDYEITPAMDNEILEDHHLNFENGKIKLEKDNLEAAWVYGLYSATSLDGFNINGDQALNEPQFKYSAHSIITYTLYEIKEDAEVQLLLDTSLRRLFESAFSRGLFNAGVYKILVELQEDERFDNYNECEAVSYYFKVDPREILIHPEVEVIYGEEISRYSSTFLGVINTTGGQAPTFTITADIDSDYRVGMPVGVYEASLSNIKLDTVLDENYIRKVETGTLTCLKRTIAITVGSKNISYLGSTQNTESKNLQFEIIKRGTSLLPLDTFDLYEYDKEYFFDIKTTLNLSQERILNDVGEYPIYLVWTKEATQIDEVTGKALKDNYEVYFVNSICKEFEISDENTVMAYEGRVPANCAGTYTVSPYLLNVQWSQTSGSSFVYNAQELTLFASATLPKLNEAEETKTVNLQLQRHKGSVLGPIIDAIKDAGEYTIIAQLPEDDAYKNYTTGDSSIEITIEPYHIDVIIGNKTIPYGTIPDLTDISIDTVSQLVEDFDSLKEILGIELHITADANTDIGSYPITATHSNMNYEAFYTNGIYTIIPREIQVAVKGYSDLTGSAANAFIKEYDGKNASDTLATLNITEYLVAEDGFQGASDDTISDLKDIDFVLDALNAGVYPLSIRSRVKNYDLQLNTTVNGTTYASDFIIQQKTLTVSATSTVVYGEDATIHYSMEGFVDGETYESLLTRSIALENLGIETVYVNTDGLGALEWTSSYQKGDSVGVYPTTVSGPLKFLNYSVEFVEREDGLEVIPRTVSLIDQTLVYSKEGYGLDAIPLQLENAYNNESIFCEATAIIHNGLPVDRITNVGSYTITISLNQSINYRFDEGMEATLSVEVIPCEISVNWLHQTVQLNETVQNVNNYLVNFDSEFMLYNSLTWTYVIHENADGSIETRNERVELQSDSMGLYYPLGNSGMGSYRVDITLNDNPETGANYKWRGTEDRTITVSFTATTSYYTLSVELSDKEYDEMPIDVSVEVNTHLTRFITTVYEKITEELYHQLKEEDEITQDTLGLGLIFNRDTISNYSRVAPTDAGYYILYSLYDRVDQFAEKFVVFRISPAAVEKPEFSLENEMIYNGEVQGIRVYGITDAMTYTVSEDVSTRLVGETLFLSAIDAKTYTIEIVLESPNYSWGDEEAVVLHWTIDLARDQEIQFKQDTIHLTYGDELDIPYTLKYPSENVSVFAFPYNDEDEYSNVNEVTPKNVGVYRIFVYASSKNYEPAIGSTLLIIEKKQVMVTANAAIQYGDKVHNQNISFSFQGFLPGENENNLVSDYFNKLEILEYNSLAPVGRYPFCLASKNVQLSDYALSATIKSLVGFDNLAGFDNYYYTLNEALSQLEIKPKELHIELGNVSSVYGEEIDLSSLSIQAIEQIPEDYSNLYELLGITLKLDTSSYSVGTYPIGVEYTNSNYNVTVQGGSYLITPKNIQIALSAGGGVYGGEILPAQVAILTELSQKELSNQEILSALIYHYVGVLNNGLTYDSYQMPSLAGRYVVTVEIDSSITRNYVLEGTATANFIIQQRIIETKGISVGQIRYIGTEILPTLYDSSLDSIAGPSVLVVKDSLGMDIYRIDRTEHYIDAGNYTISLELVDPYNMCFAIGGATFDVPFVVEKAINTVVDFTLDGWTYGEYDPELDAPYAELLFGTDELDIIYEYRRLGDTSWSTALPTDAGLYYVRAVVGSSLNYEAFTSASFELVIHKKELVLPSLDIITEGSKKNDTYTGAPLLLNIRNYQSHLMAFSYTNSSVDGDSVTITATNAGRYQVIFWITEQNQANYTWAPSENINEQGQLVLTWEIQKKKVAKPLENLENYVVNGSILTYIPEGFDENIMIIKDNQTGFGGTFTVIVELVDSDNYEWEDGTTAPVTFVWEVRGTNAIFVVLISLFSIAAVASISFVFVQVIHQRIKRKRTEEELNHSETEVSEE